MAGQDGVSAWARERFGDAAGPLRELVPQALQAAHQRAVNSQDGLATATHEPYGLIWIVQHLELVAHLKDLEEVRVFKPNGARYELVMVGNVVLYPWRYSDGTKVPLRHARLKNLSGVRRSLLALAGAAEDAPEQMTLETASVSDEQLEAERAQALQDLRELTAQVRVVFVAYASNPYGGILDIKWGDATLADEDGHLDWSYDEPLPLASGPVAAQAPGGAAAGPAPARPGGGAARAAARFDSAPMDDINLSPRTPMTEVDSGQKQDTGTTETGTDEHH
ncbi:hypothetical protein ACLQ2P_41470 [Actinomadura citrea]|uniref:hypothetical protein n=1 Tax=Actinomadura citrea TaxID=46158 RepID=UPI003CE49C3C